MKRLSVTLAASALVLLAACSNGDDTDPASTSGPTPTEATPSATTSQESPTDEFAGTWRAEDVDWTVNLESDGTFTEDFEGNEGVRSGEWAVQAGELQLIGGDGNTDAGTIEGDSIVFRLGTLTRVK